MVFLIEILEKFKVKLPRTLSKYDITSVVICLWVCSFIYIETNFAFILHLYNRPPDKGGGGNFSTKPYVICTQKNHLIETGFFEHLNHMF